MAARPARREKTRTESTNTKSKHRPSRTPTGLPGDELKALRHKRRREKLGEVVDTLLVPEHKAARRLIRRSQRRNLTMAAGSNMTLYERIMAYRLLKEKGLVKGESKDDGSEDDARKLDRSDTGWGSVDISHYTDKKDSDDNRSPTPPPTLAQPLGVRRSKQTHDNEALATARDVHVEIQDSLNSRERLPPVRSTTPKLKRTPPPTMSRQGSAEVTKHVVLPPIQDSPQMTRVRARDNSQEYKRKLENTVVDTTTTVARRERRDDSNDERKQEEYHQDVINKVREGSGNRETRKRGDRDEYDKATAIVKREHEKKAGKTNDQPVDDEREDSKSIKTKDKRLNSGEGKKEKLKEETQFTKQMSNIRQPSRELTPSPQPQKTGREPVLLKSYSNGPPSEARRPPEEKHWKSRNTPKRRTSLDDEIERLDKMVDRDLNEIIRTLGNKGQNPRGDDREEQLKKKIFDPTFQANLDKYLRDI